VGCVFLDGLLHPLPMRPCLGAKIATDKQ
jgi:hypothetical protein